MDPSLKFADEQREVNFSGLTGSDNMHGVPFSNVHTDGNQNNLSNSLMMSVSLVTVKQIHISLALLYQRLMLEQRERTQPYDYIIDGQERVATLQLLTVGAVEKAARVGHLDGVADVINTCLILRTFANNPANTKFVTSTEDRTQYKKLG
jgi:hypothetical protein